MKIYFKNYTFLLAIVFIFLIGCQKDDEQITKEVLQEIVKPESTTTAFKAHLVKLAKIGNTTLSGGRGYKNMAAFRKVEGSASPGNELHHIVEQNGFKGLNEQKFGKTNIHNTKNLIDIPGKDAGTLHKKVTGYYNSKDSRFSDTKIIREWLADKSFQFQYDFGIARLKELGWDGITGIIK